MNDAKPTGFKRVFSRWSGSHEEIHDRENKTRSSSLGGEPCSQVKPRQRATIVGALRYVTLRPRAGIPALEAELHDGSGSVKLVWLGRRGITGVETGKWVRVEGMVTQQDGHLVIFNPRYELQPGRADSTAQA